MYNYIELYDIEISMNSEFQRNRLYCCFLLLPPIVTICVACYSTMQPVSVPYTVNSFNIICIGGDKGVLILL